jgi:predicted metal-dependent hydrolase
MSATSTATTSTASFSARILTADQKPFTDDEPRFWYDNCESVTELFHALSGCFPEGEAMFVRAVSHFAKGKEAQKLMDKKLQRDVSAFISQEMHHSLEHEAYNRSIELKYKHNMAERQKNMQNHRAFNDKHPLWALAFTCSLEHITALLSHMLLGTKEGHYVLSKMAPSHRNIWIYHAIDEMEHKHVAFDVYEKVAKGGYFMRAIIHIGTVIFFFTIQVFVVIRHLMDNGSQFKWRNYVDLFNFLFGYPGMLRLAIPQLLMYLKPNFHPNDVDDSSLIKEWSEKLKAANK